MKLSLALVAFVLTLSSHATPALERRQTQSNNSGAPTKQIAHFPGQLITYTSTLPVTEVLSRLDTQLNKAAGGVDTLHTLVNQAQTRSELVASMDNLYGSHDFLYVLVSLIPGVSVNILAIYQVVFPVGFRSLFENLLKFNFNDESKGDCLYFGKPDACSANNGVQSPFGDRYPPSDSNPRE